MTVWQRHIGDYSYLTRQRNRALPLFKKKLKAIPGPLKKREEAWIKHFQISKKHEDGGLVIY